MIRDCISAADVAEEESGPEMMMEEVGMIHQVMPADLDQIPYIQEVTA